MTDWVAFENRARIREYDKAAERFSRAVERRPEAIAEAARIIADAEAEYDAASVALEQYELRPGIPKPEYRS